MRGGPPRSTDAVRAGFRRPTLEVAERLLGMRLVREPVDASERRRVGRIVEVEAYIGEDDQASHARFGRTARNAVMYGAPGTAYVYLVYGMYHCLNVVTEPAGRPAAILIRAVEPVAGIDAMRAARVREARARRRDPAVAARQAARLGALAAARLAAGPGLVAAAFDLDRGLTGSDLLDPLAPVHLEAAPPGEAAPRIVATPRIGIGYAGAPWVDRPWRLVDAESGAVSGSIGTGRIDRRREGAGLDGGGEGR